MEVSVQEDGSSTTPADNAVFSLLPEPWARHCQTNLSRRAKGAGPRRSGRQLPPFGQGGGTVLFEDVAAIEVTILIEMIMDRGVDGTGDRYYNNGFRVARTL